MANEAIDTTTYYLPYVQAAAGQPAAWPARVGHRWQRSRTRLRVTFDQRRLQEARFAAVLAGRQRQERASVRADPHRIGPQSRRLAAHRASRRLSGRWRVRRSGVARDPAEAGLELCLPHGQERRVAGGRRAFSPTDLLLAPGDRIELPDVGFTAAEYGPVLVSIIWERRWKEPLVLVSNLDFLPEAYGWYQRRFRIETFFSDQKSRGFYLGHSHISDTAHLERLLIGTCLAYLWMVCLGAWVLRAGSCR